MAIRIGTSGFSYKEWKKNFYPADLPESRFLPFYATRFDAVEIDSTFYRMPTPKALDAWHEATPEPFRFAIKASQRITHRKRLKDAAEEVDWFYRVAAALGTRAGPTLFQLPPTCSPTTPSGCRRSRSTTPSTGCRAARWWRAGRPACPTRFASR